MRAFFIGVIVLFFGASAVFGNSDIYNETEFVLVNQQTPSPLSLNSEQNEIEIYLGGILPPKGLPDDDWDFLTHPPHMFAIPAGNVGIGLPIPTQKLEVAGIIYSNTGGFKFPDGTIQTSAASVSGEGNTLDQAYDEGGPGAGRTIFADDGAVNIEGSDGLTVTGNVGIGTITASEKLDVDGTVLMTGFKMPTDAIEGYVLTCDGSGVGTWQPGDSVGGIDGSGTTGFLPKFVGSITIGDSAIYESGDNIGIGTTNPQTKLDVEVTNDGAASFEISRFSRRRTASRRYRLFL